VLGEFEGGSLLAGDRGPEPFPGIYVPAMMEVILGEGGALRRGLERCVTTGLARVTAVPVEMRPGLANWNHPEDVRD